MQHIKTATTLRNSKRSPSDSLIDFLAQVDSPLAGQRLGRAYLEAELELNGNDLGLKLVSGPRYRLRVSFADLFSRPALAPV